MPHLLFHFAIGVFIARGKEDALVTKNLVPGEAVYGEKRISIDVSIDARKHTWLFLLPLKIVICLILNKKVAICFIRNCTTLHKSALSISAK